MDDVSIRPKAEEKEVGLLGDGWTDDKHRSYLNLIEAVFIENLYGREYCAVDISGRAAGHRASQKQILVDNASITPTDLPRLKKQLGSQDDVLHLQLGCLPGLPSRPLPRRFINDLYDDFGGLGIVGKARGCGDTETSVEKDAARKKKIKKRDFLLEVPDIDEEGYLEHVSAESRSISTGSCSLVCKRQRSQKRELNNIYPIKGNGKKMKSELNLSLPDLEDHHRYAPEHHAKGSKIQISAHHRLKQMQERPPPQRRKSGLQLHSTGEYVKVRRPVRFSKQASGCAEEIADSDQIVPSSGNDNHRNHVLLVSKLIASQTKADTLSSSTVEVTVERGSCLGSTEIIRSQHVKETAHNTTEKLRGSAEAYTGGQVIPQEVPTFDPDLETEMHRSRGETATRQQTSMKWASGIRGFRGEKENRVKKARRDRDT